MDSIYAFLYNIGYPHPLHPMLTHAPIGLGTGALILGILGLILHREDVAQAARFCAGIALAFIFPTVLLGVMDWQHYFAGGWINAIKVKIALAALLLIIYSITLIFFRHRPMTAKAVIAYGCSFLIMVGLGFFGGQLVYSGKVPAAPPGLQKGAYVFRANCSGCHPYGGNIIDRDATITGSPEIKDLKRFVHWIRDPRLDNGKKGPMPDFTPSRISEEQARELWAYLSYLEGP